MISKECCRRERPRGGREREPRSGNASLSVGSLTRPHAYKGFDTVIRALPGVLKRVPNLRYVIVGEGDDRPRLEKLVAELQLETVCNLRRLRFGRASGGILSVLARCLFFPVKRRRETEAGKGKGSEESMSRLPWRANLSLGS